MVRHLAKLITYAKFQNDIFRGYDFTGGQISHFPIDFCMGLTTVQRDCAACDIKRDVFVTFIFAVFLPYFMLYRPMYIHRLAILHQPAKFRSNRRFVGGVMTSYPFSQDGGLQPYWI